MKPFKLFGGNMALYAHVFVVILNLIYLGFVGPFLLSYASTELVIFGCILSLGLIIFDINYISSIFKNKKETDEKN